MRVRAWVGTCVRGCCCFSFVSLPNIFFHHFFLNLTPPLLQNPLIQLLFRQYRYYKVANPIIDTHARTHSLTHSPIYINQIKGHWLNTRNLKNNNNNNEWILRNRYVFQFEFSLSFPKHSTRCNFSSANNNPTDLKKKSISIKFLFFFLFSLSHWKINRKKKSHRRKKEKGKKGKGKRKKIKGNFFFF